MRRPRVLDGRLGDGLDIAAWATLAIAICVGAGSLFGSLAGPIRGNRLLPWLAGRSLGLGAYAALSAMILLGLWMRHPWRFRWPLLHPEVRLRVHAALGVATTLLVIGHLSALAEDHYAGVGWKGALVPGLAHYRTAAVAIGVGAFYLMVLVTVSAALAGRVGTHHWLQIHRLALCIFASSWAHGAFAGTDTPQLRWMYGATGFAVVAVAATRHLASPPAVTTVPPASS